MAYATQAAVQTKVGGSDNLRQLSDLEDTGAINVAVVADAIAEADGVINGYLRQRYDVPLASPTPEIVACANRWAARILRANRYQGQPIAEDLDAEKVDREWLMLIAGGKIRPSASVEPPKAEIIVDKAGERDTSLTVSKVKLQGFI